jgi:hypothetical protein
MPVTVTTPVEVAAAVTTGAGAAAQHGFTAARRLAHGTRAATLRLHITPRLAFIAGITVAALLALAALVGYFAGRGVPGLK